MLVRLDIKIAEARAHAPGSVTTRKLIFGIHTEVGRHSGCNDLSFPEVKSVGPGTPRTVALLRYELMLFRFISCFVALYSTPQGSSHGKMMDMPKTG